MDLDPFQSAISGSDPPPPPPPAANPVFPAWPPSPEAPAEYEATAVDDAPTSAPADDGTGGGAGWLLPGWIMRGDPVSGRAYYFNTVTGESQWDAPVRDVPRESPASERRLSKVPRRSTPPSLCSPDLAPI